MENNARKQPPNDGDREGRTLAAQSISGPTTSIARMKLSDHLSRAESKVTSLFSSETEAEHTALDAREDYAIKRGSIPASWVGGRRFYRTSAMVYYTTGKYNLSLNPVILNLEDKSCDSQK